MPRYFSCVARHLWSLAHGYPLSALLLAASLALAPQAALAASTAADNPAVAPAHGKHPRVCLVLSGGGARGYAHIGVIRALEKMHVPIDCIAATSMGAVVGGLYASGLSASELEARLSHINLSDIAFDRNERAELPQAQREDDLQYPIGISVGYGDGQIKLPTGLVQGNRLLALLQNWTAQLPADTDFNRLPIPFRTIATDLGTGQPVILDHGSLPRAIRASVAVPGLFAPIKVDGRTLVDGGLVSNLPVQLARDMGADVIIAVNIASPLDDPASLDSPAAVTQQMVTILMNQNVTAQKQRLGPGDVLIEPQLGDLSFTDFSRANDGIQGGWNAMLAAEPRLASLALPAGAWQAYLAARKPAQAVAGPVRIDAIEIQSHGKIPASFVRKYLGVNEGDTYDAITLNREMAQLSTSGDFESVTQELLTENGRNVLKVEAQQKSWGPQFLLFGFGVSNTFNGQGSFNLQLGHRYPWLTPGGLEWRNDIVLGSSQAKWHTELRQPVFDRLGFYVAPYAEYGRKRVDLYSDIAPNRNTEPLTAYQIETAVAGLDLGVPLGRLGEFRAGVNYQQVNYAAAYNLPFGTGKLFPRARVRQPVARAQLTIDQLDDPLFPRTGYYLLATNELAFGGTDNRFNDAHAKALWATSYGRHTLNLAAEAAATYGDHRSDNSSSGGLGFTLGGFQHLSAYAQDQFSGNFLLYGRLTYLNDLREFILPGFRSTVVGASLEGGDVWLRRKNFGNGPFKSSASLFIGGNSAIGPLYFGFAAAPNGVWNLYLQLGRVF
ncbi:patatin-like phospholipase family protein [Cupriavidus basilensis]|uniref:Patatin-like phospholipase family protein n=1 Tax=Cupriavidus basilensis TaxID=68895 RepID=A0ABT6ALU3_9BURK|nr:patatin-like phospholipase family protein [Cupriavidus basilensis]MDF3833575.1 patatin-like phospholipase family protein [Cupriavidus basilensis]